MRVLKTEDCFYVAGGGEDSGAIGGQSSEAGNYDGSWGGNYAGSDNADDCGRLDRAKALAKEIGIGLGINGIYDAITGLFNNNGTPANPGTGNPMGDPGPAYSSGGENGSR